MRDRYPWSWLVAVVLIGLTVVGCTDGDAQIKQSPPDPSGGAVLPRTPTSTATANGSPSSTITSATSGAGAQHDTEPTPAQARDLRLTFSEMFDQGRLDTGRWSTCHWWDPARCTIASNHELQWYEPGQVTVRDGQLLLTAEHSSGSDRDSHPFVSGMVSTGPQVEGGRAKYDFTYGYVEVRLTLPRGKGLWPAVWMLPSSTDSRPEIDLLEVIGQAPDTWLFHLHPKNRDAQSHNKTQRRADLGQGVHTLGLDWRPGRLVWFVDGQQVWQITGSDVPSEPMYLVLNLAVGGEYPGSPDGSTRFPAIMTVDSVRVWQ